jgi:hypothetical protein
MLMNFIIVQELFFIKIDKMIFNNMFFKSLFYKSKFNDFNMF